MKAEMDRWEACKKKLNVRLGPFRDDERVLAVYVEIDGDFGVPTTSDVDDFLVMLKRIHFCGPKVKQAARILLNYRKQMEVGK